METLAPVAPLARLRAIDWGSVVPYFAPAKWNELGHTFATPNNPRLVDSCILLPLAISNITKFDGGSPNIVTSTSLDKRLLAPPVPLSAYSERKIRFLLPTFNCSSLSATSSTLSRWPTFDSMNSANYIPQGSTFTIFSKPSPLKESSLSWTIFSKATLLLSMLDNKHSWLAIIVGLFYTQLY